MLFLEMAKIQSGIIWGQISRDQSASLGDAKFEVSETPSGDVESAF